MRRRTNSTNSTYSSAYNTAREYPGTIAAVIIGIGVTAALLWAARRAGGWSELQAAAAERARQGYDYAREGYNRIKNQQESLTE
jgi:hypothetical protein